MVFSKDGRRTAPRRRSRSSRSGWAADTAGLNLAAAGVETDPRGFVRVDAYLRTSAPHVFAAGDITGRLMLVPQAIQDGFVAATNAVRGATTTLADQVSPIGSFTDPEYAQVGLTEAKARETHDVVVAMVRFDATTRTIIDGRTAGFCKLIVDRATCTILGCHVVGERAVEIVQVVAIAMAAGMRVDALARVPLSFPTYAGISVRAAYRPRPAARSGSRVASGRLKAGELLSYGRLAQLIDRVEARVVGNPDGFTEQLDDEPDDGADADVRHDWDN